METSLQIQDQTRADSCLRGNPIIDGGGMTSEECPEEDGHSHCMGIGMALKESSRPERNIVEALNILDDLKNEDTTSCGDSKATTSSLGQRHLPEHLTRKLYYDLTKIVKEGDPERRKREDSGYATRSGTPLACSTLPSDTEMDDDDSSNTTSWISLRDTTACSPKRKLSKSQTKSTNFHKDLRLPQAFWSQDTEVSDWSFDQGGTYNNEEYKDKSTMKCITKQKQSFCREVLQGKTDTDQRDKEITDCQERKNSNDRKRNFKDAESNSENVKCNLKDAQSKPDDAEVNPNDAETNPKDAESNPDDAEGNPIDAETNPNDAQSNPDDAEGNIKDAETNLIDAHSNPEGNPNDAETNPKEAESKPDDAGRCIKSHTTERRDTEVDLGNDCNLYGVDCGASDATDMVHQDENTKTDKIIKIDQILVLDEILEVDEVLKENKIVENGDFYTTLELLIDEEEPGLLYTADTILNLFDPEIAELDRFYSIDHNEGLFFLNECYSEGIQLATTYYVR